VSSPTLTPLAPAGLATGSSGVARARTVVALFVAAVAIGLAVWAARDPVPPPFAGAPGSFSFAAMGDAPYYWHEENQFERVLWQLEQADLSFVVSVGDILWRPCSDVLYERRLGQFQTLRHPVVYTPGDNEWADCHEARVGGYDPLERLGSLRRTLFSSPEISLGARRLPLQPQSAVEGFAEFVENARWQHEGVTFSTVHIVGSGNAAESFDGRTEANDREVARRTAAAIDWIRRSFVAAHESGSRAIVLMTHADLVFEYPKDPYRIPFEAIIRTLEVEAGEFPGPVLLVHGDSHEYIVDSPLRSRVTGVPVPNFTRLQVPGSYDVGWVRVGVAAGRSPEFTFERFVIPRWKVW
jgi:hypothetical protein